MTRSARPWICLLAVMLAPAGASAEPARYKIDPQHFAIVFNGLHIGYERQWGMFLRGGGEFTYDHDAKALSDLSVTIEAGSVFSNDEERDGHLRSADFLDAEAHPDITFVMTEAVPETDTTGTVSGDLTIRGETRPVTLDVTLNKIGPYPWGDNFVVGITATTTLMREDWGMTYALDNGLVGPDVPIIIELEAIRQDD